MVQEDFMKVSVAALQCFRAFDVIVAICDERDFAVQDFMNMVVKIFQTHLHEVLQTA